MKRTETFVRELHSVNAFSHLVSLATKDLESAKDPSLVETIASNLSAVYAAETMASRLDHLHILMETLSPYEHIPLLKDLMNQCRFIQQIMLGVNRHTNVATLVAERNLRLPFNPAFVRNPPKDSPFHQLLDELVAWQQEANPHTKTEKMQKIIGDFGCTADQFLQLSDEAKFIVLGRTKKILHLLKHGTSKIKKVESQAEKIEASPKELEKHRVYSMGGRLYQLHLEGEGNDQRFKISYFTTEESLADGVHYGESSFTVTLLGDIYALPNADPNPFFAGRMAVDQNGVLTFYNNASEIFDHDEHNLLCLTRYFFDCDLIGYSNPNVVCALVKKRELVSAQSAFIQYLSKFEQFPLWEANENIFKLRERKEVLQDDEGLNELRKQAVSEQNKKLRALYKQYQQTGTVPTWLQRWKDDHKSWKNGVENPRHSFPPLHANLGSDPLNLHSFFSNKWIKALPYVQCRTAAEDDRAAGIRNDFHKGELNQTAVQAQASLKKWRDKIRLKERLDVEKFQMEVRMLRPNNMVFGKIYFYPHHASTSDCSFCFLIDNSGTRIQEGQISFTAEDKTYSARTKLKTYIKPSGVADPKKFSTNEMEQLKALALEIQPYEMYLMLAPQELYNKSEAEVVAIKRAVESNVPADVAMAFFDDVRTNSLARQRHYLHFHFDSPKKPQPELPGIDHWASSEPEAKKESEKIEDFLDGSPIQRTLGGEDFDTPAYVVHKDNHFG